MNIERLKILKETVLQSESFDQEKYFWSLGKQDKDNFGKVRFACGTPACVAGHAIALFSKAPAKVPGDYVSYPTIDPETEAAELLDISDLNASILFDEDPYWETEQWGATKEQAAGAIQSLIETGRVKWPGSK